MGRSREGAESEIGELSRTNHHLQPLNIEVWDLSSGMLLIGPLNGSPATRGRLTNYSVAGMAVTCLCSPSADAVKNVGPSDTPAKPSIDNGNWMGFQDQIQSEARVLDQRAASQSVRAAALISCSFPAGYQLVSPHGLVS